MKTKSIQLDQTLVDQAEALAPAHKRSVAAQIEHWARIGKLMEENPDLPYAFVKEAFNAKAEMAKSALEPYQLGYDSINSKP